MSTEREPVIRAASDLHGHLPEVEQCDVLILAGDLIPQEAERDVALGRRWLAGPFAKWLDDVPAKELVGIGGNHDFVLEQCAGGRGSHPWLFDARWTSLHDAGLTLECGLKVWGTAWVPGGGGFASSSRDIALDHYFKEIPKGLDVLIAHGPPEGIGDRGFGSKALSRAILRTHPRLVVYGHIHSEGGYRHRTTTTTYANVSVVDENYKLVRGISEPLGSA